MSKSRDMDRVKFEGPATYRITVRGFLRETKSDILAGMRITSESRGDQKPVSTLIGRLVDQAELSGVLNTLYEMHLSILSVEVLEDDGESVRIYAYQALDAFGPKALPTLEKARTRKDGSIRALLDRLFEEHPHLRLDDKEVLRFIAESGGEVFAAELRERFKVPRTSLWRMIRRLEREEVVDVSTIGGQSLVKISQTYREGGS